MSDISAVKLIRAVKARPSLYNKEDSRYHKHYKYRSKIWKEVCKEVIPNWNELNSSQKFERDLELQRRWKSLRTCFTRELLLQKKENTTKQNGADAHGHSKRRKKYEHFDALSFLLNPENVEAESKPNDSNEDESEDENESSDPLDNEIKIENLFDYTDHLKNSDHMQQVLPVEIESNEEQFHTTFERPQGSRVVEEKLLDLLKDKKTEEEDEDRQFILSLLPGFKKLTDKQKYEAKIEILKVLMNVSFQDKNDA